MSKEISNTTFSRLLVLSGFIGLLGLFAFFGVEIHKVIHPNGPTIRHHDGPASWLPFGRAISVVLFIVVLSSKRRVWLSLFFSLAAIFPFLFEFTNYYHSLYDEPRILDDRSAFSLLFLMANPLDYLIPVLLITLILWQLSILVSHYLGSKVEE